ncbi:MAG TPA: hemerythrin domain-containing protein [Anaerolineae bacterium]|jgi:hemerythrin-like domain-containing protein
MKITEALAVEHRLLRAMMDALGQWLSEGMAEDRLRQRAAMLELAIDDHTAREEQLLFDPLCAAHPEAREQVDLMVVVHDEVRGLFAEVSDPARTVKDRLWTILMLTGEHFTKEETAIFPLAEELMGASLPQVSL